jgi:hypothetical protein
MKRSQGGAALAESLLGLEPMKPGIKKGEKASHF